MKVKLVNQEHAAGLIDPQTRRSPFLDADGQVLATADVPENVFWVRRLRAGEIELVASAPTGNEPVQPLTTRAGK